MPLYEVVEQEKRKLDDSDRRLPQRAVHGLLPFFV